MTTAESTTDPRAEGIRSRWQRWRVDREAALLAPDGPLAFTALQWITDGWAVFDGVPGTWRVDGTGESAAVLLDARAADGLEFEGETVDGTLALAAHEGGPGLRVRDGERLLEVIRRSGRFAVRVLDPDSRGRIEFDGVPVFEPSDRWIVPACFHPFDDVRTVVTGAVIDGLEHHHRAVGVLRFAVHGDDHTLVAFAGPERTLRVLFTDRTSGVTTYPSARLLAVPAPGDDGTTVLDFTRAANLPCAFTAYATCPIAPAENRLPFAVEAGEKDPAR
ncbi:DUF1684 domain-containing protein [Rhodococcus rhodnii]|uniref:DUF1684 domain-containing protein n=2 Tax=Rhodococcus rhodnii TaxID=38312 RepID=R7WV28_9NOCA|nr:DUF1684 domain-containing protein [Rhodococcus rhodnii]EOM77999.1 hypothetical protein Rrhod_0673 [Rhodococcus rhodnii LMG 5362]TXG92060.1 DUF1684 domain-containing protein [Rhodococcus rhodnii]